MSETNPPPAVAPAQPVDPPPPPMVDISIIGQFERGDTLPLAETRIAKQQD